METLILVIIAFIVGVGSGFVVIPLLRPKVGDLVITHVATDMDGPYLLLELREDVKALSEHKNVSMRIVKR